MGTHVTISKDGQPVTLPFEEVTGRELKQQLDIPNERIMTVVENGQTREIGEHERVQLRDGLYLSDTPRFRYGATATSNTGSPAVGRRLAQEVDYVSTAYRQCAEFGFDPDPQRWWVLLPCFYLPPGWNAISTPIMVVVNDHYPASGPDGFYLSQTLRHANGRTPGHYFEQRAALNSYAQRGWAWFCIHPEWRSTADVRTGDSILKYLTLVHLALSQALL